MKSRSEIGRMLKERILLLDGSYGAEFIRRSEVDMEVPDCLNLTNPDLVKGIHCEYVEAGSDMILTNTLGATPAKLGEFGLGARTPTGDMQFNTEHTLHHQCPFRPDALNDVLFHITPPSSSCALRACRSWAGECLRSGYPTRRHVHGQREVAGPGH